jgi:[NiFe] hydrogenase diaphorase moiety large subunit
MSDADPIDAVLAHHRHDGTRLMQILRKTQEALGWLAPETITRIAAGVGWPRAPAAAVSGHPGLPESADDRQ